MSNPTLSHTYYHIDSDPLGYNRPNYRAYRAAEMAEGIANLLNRGSSSSAAHTLTEGRRRLVQLSYQIYEADQRGDSIDNLVAQRTAVREDLQRLSQQLFAQLRDSGRMGPSILRIVGNMIYGRPYDTVFDVDQPHITYEYGPQPIPESFYAGPYLGENEDLECSICLEPALPDEGVDGEHNDAWSADRFVKTWKCGHVFHSHCLRTWVTNSGQPSGLRCPMCRQFLVEPRTGHPLQAETVQETNE